MATPVARSLFNDGKASLRLIRPSLLRPSNTTAVKDKSLLAPPSGVILGQCQFQNPSHTDLNPQVKVSTPHLFGRSSLVGGEDWRGSGSNYSLAAEDELEMRRRKEISDEKDEDEDGSDADDAGDVGDFDIGDFDDDDDDDEDYEDDDDVDVPRKMRK
ncbi:uncharacterized protein J3R85_009394 [Psidium guajava]|nr:uncharacterized protein J3R85_009394 [Psidium guajava]